MQPAGGQRLETSARAARGLPFRATPWTTCARRSAWLLWAATLVVTAVGLALMVWDWSTPVPSGSFGVRGFSGLWAVGFGSVGALLTRRRPGHPVGWIFAAAGVVAAVGFAR